MAEEKNKWELYQEIDKLQHQIHKLEVAERKKRYESLEGKCLVFLDKKDGNSNHYSTYAKVMSTDDHGNPIGISFNPDTPFGVEASTLSDLSAVFMGHYKIITQRQFTAAIKRMQKRIDKMDIIFPLEKKKAKK